MPVNKNNIDVTRDKCAITVTIRVEFNKVGKLGTADNFKNLVRNWTLHTENVLNGPRPPRKWQCCNVKFRVISKVGQGTPNYHQVRVEDGPGTWNGGKSFTNPAAGTGQSNQTDWAMITAHEIGHALGLDDEYHYETDANGNNKWVNDNPQPDGQPQSIMAQTWGVVAFLQSHIDKIMKAVGAECPEECCPSPPAKHVAPPVEKQTPKPERKLEVKTVRTLPLETVLDAVKAGNVADVQIARDELTRRLRREGKKLALTDYLADASPIVRWLAWDCLVRTGRVEPESLATGLDDPCESVRLICAYALAQRRLSSAIGAFVNATFSPEPLISHPPVRACDFAYSALEKFTSLSFGVDEFGDEERRAAIGDAWRAWYQGSAELPPQVWRPSR